MRQPLWISITVGLTTAALSGCCDAEKAGEKLGSAATRFLGGAARAVAKEGEKTGEALGEGAAKLTTGAARGVGKHGDKVGEAVGGASGKLLEGAVKGVGKSLGYRDLKVELAPELQSERIVVARSRVSLDDKRIFLDLQVPAGFERKLQLSAVDDKGLQLFSATSTAKLEKGGAPARVVFNAPQDFVAFEVARYRLSPVR